MSAPTADYAPEPFIRPDLLVSTERARPAHITEADWERMSWHARSKATRHLVAEYRDRDPEPRPRADLTDEACGTLTGAKRHARRHELACEACLEARRVYTRALRARKRELLEQEVALMLERAAAETVAEMVDAVSPVLRPRADLSPCGTHAAYERHRKRGETPCGPCRAAHSMHVADCSRRARAARADREREAS